MATRKWFHGALPMFHRHRRGSMSSENMQDLAENSPSDIPHLLSTISDLLQPLGASWCVVGDALLVHYRVPQITKIPDIEICVQSENFKDVDAFFGSQFDFCSRLPHDKSKYYSGRLVSVPRFKVIGGTQCFSIVPSSHYGLSPRAFSDLQDGSAYGKSALLPLPHYVQGLSSVLTSQSEENQKFVAQIEHLIDGMDIDEDWCHRYLDGPAQEYVRGRSTPTAKKARMGSDQDGNLTRYIRDEEERRAASEVVGRTLDIRPSPSHTLPIQIMSDLHLEFPFRGPENNTIFGYEAFDCKPCAPVLCLLGDIGLVSQDGLFFFLRRQLLKYEKVLYVMGNHEYYRSSYEEANTRMKEFSDEIKKERESEGSLGEFILLDQTRVDLNANITILGCTLWSNIPIAARENVAMCLNDFRQIREWTVETYNAAHNADATWLDTMCAQIRAEEPDRRIIVLTHHAPAVAGTSAPRYETGPSSFNTAFATDMSGRSCWGPPLEMWASGHTHFCCDFVRDGVRVVSNQRGYEGTETPYSSFRDDFVLYI